ncbi:MAG TPA: hypothetical protein PLA87_22585 [Pseudomonadota bacterium]|jgi:hypothetical protein|nr:hypothetical protein [Pseudomonadota bacterium]
MSGQRFKLLFGALQGVRKFCFFAPEGKAMISTVQCYNMTLLYHLRD